jgi:hypothetical protein
VWRLSKWSDAGCDTNRKANPFPTVSRASHDAATGFWTVAGTGVTRQFRGRAALVRGTEESDRGSRHEGFGCLFDSSNGNEGSDSTSDRQHDKVNDSVRLYCEPPGVSVTAPDPSSILTPLVPWPSLRPLPSGRVYSNTSGSHSRQ